MQSIAGFLTGTYGHREHLYSGLKATLDSYPPYTRINRAGADMGEVHRFLTLAWTSEIQLHLPALMGNTAMLGFANAWAPVHAYYAVFGALQAWFAANGMSGTANDHTATLKTIASQIEQRDLFPEPWNLLAVGCPMRDEKIHLNDRGRDCTSHVEVLTIPAPFGVDPEFWRRLGTWVRSTRAARLTAREEQWKKRHCFWRMRIKSNYGTIDPYLVSMISEDDHSIFNSSLCTATRATLALLELYVLRRIGKAEFEKIATEFVKQDSHNLTTRTLQARLKPYGISA